MVALLHGFSSAWSICEQPLHAMAHAVNVCHNMIGVVFCNAAAAPHAEGVNAG